MADYSRVFLGMTSEQIEWVIAELVAFTGSPEEQVRDGMAELAHPSKFDNPVRTCLEPSETFRG